MSTRRNGRVTLAVLVSILAVAALLRVVGIENGLPHVVGVDEGFEVHRALRLGAGEIDLERNGKGGFFYLLFVEYGLYFVWLRLTGQVGGTADFARAFEADLTPFWMLGRVTHAALAALTVYWTYRLGRRVYGERAGLFAAAALAVSALHVSHSQYIGVDIPMTLLVVVVLDLAIRWSDPETRPRPLLLGAALGAAVMTKIVAVAAVVPVVVANFLRRRDAAWPRRWLDSKILVAYGAAALLFSIGNPGFLLDLGSFTREALAILLGVGEDAQSPISSGAADAPNLWIYYVRILERDFGFALVILAAAGLLYACLRRRNADLILVASVVAFYLLIAGARTSHLFYPRYALPLLPPLALLGGRLLDRIALRLPWSRARAELAMLLVTIALVAPMAAQAARWTTGRLLEDSRITTRQWFEQQATEGVAVFMIGNPVVDTAPNLSLPLRNTDANLDDLIDELAASEPTKARMLEYRKETAVGKAFDLRTVLHTEPNRSLDHYLEHGVRYFVLDEHHFGSARLERDRRHEPAVLESRRELARACRVDPRLERVFSTDEANRELTGPRIEVFAAGGAE